MNSRRIKRRIRGLFYERFRSGFISLSAAQAMQQLGVAEIAFISVVEKDGLPTPDRQVTDLIQVEMFSRRFSGRAPAFALSYQRYPSSQAMRSKSSSKNIKKRAWPQP